MPGVYVM